uniref:Aminotransferase class I and II n=1 Tax=Candidatus Kentrum sp. FW TaxID=2126338 RepID=A0A450U3L6_9GAMM|nr:MAG: Aminotransferase class I and II [Candidatus Kentron sp. FW]
MANITPFYVMDIFARAKKLAAQGRRIIHMEIGEPDFQAPEPVIQSAIQALTEGHTRYTATLGLPALRERIADFYLRRHGVNIPWRRIVVTPGTSGALQLALAVLINPGDGVLVSDPGYPSNRNMIRVFGGSVVDIPVGPDTRYQPTPDLMARHAIDGGGNRDDTIEPDRLPHARAGYDGHHRASEPSEYPACGG